MPCKLALPSSLCQVSPMSLVLLSIYLEKVLCNKFQHHHISVSIGEGWKPLSNLFLTGDNDLMVGRRNKLQGLTEKTCYQCKCVREWEQWGQEQDHCRNHQIQQTKGPDEGVAAFFFFYFFFFVADLMFLRIWLFKEYFVSQALQLAWNECLPFSPI